MSFLKTILVELHNCLNVEKDIPLVWSREFAVKLKQNTDHWNKVQRQRSSVGDMDFPDDEQIRIPYHHEEEEEDAGAFFAGSRRPARGRYKDMERDARNDPEDPARDDYAGFGGDEEPDRMDPRNEIGDEDEDEDLYQQRDNYNKGLVPDEEDSHLTDWGREYHNQGEENEEGGFAAFMSDRESEEEEERKAHFSVGSERSEYDDDCPTCFGTGHDFPRLKTYCHLIYQ